VLLRTTIRLLKRLTVYLRAVEYHWLANRAADQLRLHDNKALRDIGLGDRGQIRQAAHSKCPICLPDVYEAWLNDDA